MGLIDYVIYMLLKFYSTRFSAQPKIVVLWCSGYELGFPCGLSVFDTRQYHLTLKPWASFLNGTAYHSHKPKTYE